MLVSSNPLGMVDTGFGVEASELERLSAMYGLPDLIGEGYDGGQLVEAALSGFNERIDVSVHVSDRYAPEVFAAAGSACSQPRGTTFGLPRCWPTAASSTASA